MQMHLSGGSAPAAVQHCETGGARVPIHVTGGEVVPIDESYFVLAAEVLDALPELVVRFGVDDHRISYCNVAWAQRHGLTPAEVLGRPLDDFLSVDGIEGMNSQLELLSHEQSLVVDRVLRTDPALPGRFIEWVDRYLPSGEIIAVGRDATERHQAQLELVASEARFRELADESSDIVWRVLFEPSPHFDYLSPSVEKHSGVPASVLLDDFSKFATFLDESGHALIQRALHGGPLPDRADLTGYRADGSPNIIEVHLTKIPGGLQGVGSDVTEIRRLQAEVEARAFHDALTGLANRHLLDEILVVSLARTQRHDSTLAVAFVDLDGFKAVNDGSGHAAGDEVLCETARRLRAVARAHDVVARIGGDEFIVVYEPRDAESDHLIERLTAALAEPFEVSPGLLVSCAGSVGVATTDECGYDADSLLAAADARMYEVKRLRKALSADRWSPGSLSRAV